MATQAEPTYPSVWSHLARTAFRQDWVNAAGVNTRYVQAGAPDAPTVVMLHGVAASWESFCANIGPLSQHFNVIAIDEIGCGFSDKPPVDYDLFTYAKHVAAVMDALEVKVAHLIGVSMGGMISQRFAVEYPQRLKKLVLISTMAGKQPMWEPAMAKALENLALERDKAVRNPTWENVSPVVDTLIHDPKKRIADFVAIRQAMYSLPEMPATLERIMRVTDSAFYNRAALSDDEIRSIGAPTLIVTSDRDAPSFRAAAEKLKSLVPNSRKVEFKDVGHWPHFEDPAAFNALAVDFLSEE